MYGRDLWWPYYVNGTASSQGIFLREPQELRPASYLEHAVAVLPTGLSINGEASVQRCPPRKIWFPPARHHQSRGSRLHDEFCEVTFSKYTLTTTS